MSLSSCSQCKNYSDEVCLLGQSYIDVFSSIQTLAEEQDRQRLGQLLASCGYWEESDLSKLFSHDVTLSYHAWNRLAYMKIQSGDQELFQNLINAARNVVLQQRQAADPVAGAAVSNLLNAPASPSPEAAVPPVAPEPVAVVDDQIAPTDLQSSVEPVAPAPLEAEASLPPQVDAPAPVAEAMPPASVLPLSAPVKMPAPPVHPEMEGQPSLPTAADPIEVAMQELWAMATSTRNGAHHGQPLGEILASGRGTGRIDPAAE